jgi:signal transduction histidine kinase
MTARLHDSFQRIREFTLHASHELKTPLTILHGEMETALTDEPLTASQRDRIASELDEVQRLAKIVDGLTLLTKADAGQIQLKREPLQFDDIVRDVFADAQILAKPESLQVQLATCEPVTIQGDRHRLRQLLLNLVDNAIKYNAPRGLVTIALVRVHEYAELTVANTGPGIPHTALPRVFDRFYRADQAHSDTVEGCGLGLSIAQWIVSAHGGQIQIASEPDVKTSLVVRLPLHTPDAQAP